MHRSYRLLIACVGFVSGAAVIKRQDAPIDSCPGYAASNVVIGDSSLTADLKLAGDACNVYGDDLADLKLEVEYQSSMQLSTYKNIKLGLSFVQAQDYMSRYSTLAEMSTKSQNQFSQDQQGHPTLLTPHSNSPYRRIPFPLLCHDEVVIMYFSTHLDHL